MSVADRIRVPGLTVGEQDEFDGLWATLRARMPRNSLRQAYCDFDHVVRQVASVVPPAYYRMGAVLGWTGKAVDALTRRCNLEGFTWSEGDLDDLGFRQYRDDNHFDATFKAAVSASARLGVSFLINTTGGEGEPASLLHYKDALNATGRWNNRTRSLRSALSVTEWDDDRAKPASFVLYLDGLTVNAWREGGAWKVDRQEHGWGVPVEPVIYKPFSRPFGASRITKPMMYLQDRAVASLIRMDAHMDIYAIPDFWLLGADMGMFRDASGAQQAAWQVMMGRIKALPDSEKRIDEGDTELARADIKHFPAQSPEPHLANINGLAKLFAREADLPDSSLAISDVANPTSADSYVESRESLIAEAEGAMDDWSLPARRAVTRGLAILNGLDEVPAAWASVESKWRSPVFLSRTQAAMAGSQTLAALPEWVKDTEVGWEIAGLSEQQITRLRAEQRRTEGRAALAALSGAVRGTDSVDPARPAESAEEMKAKFDALGVAIRAGVDPQDAARRLGLSGIEFTGAIPVSLRPPQADAAKLEDR